MAAAGRDQDGRPSELERATSTASDISSKKGRKHLGASCLLGFLTPPFVGLCLPTRRIKGNRPSREKTLGKRTWATSFLLYVRQKKPRYDLLQFSAGHHFAIRTTPENG
jgi:hypothetical protein